MCLHVIVCVTFYTAYYILCIIVTWWSWWDWSLIWPTIFVLPFRAIWHCWLGHLTCKNLLPAANILALKTVHKMTYNLFNRTLNSNSNYKYLLDFGSLRGWIRQAYEVYSAVTNHKLCHNFGSIGHPNLNFWGVRYPQRLFHSFVHSLIFFSLSVFTGKFVYACSLCTAIIYFFD